MADPFSELVGALTASQLGTDVVVTRGVATVATCRALLRKRDQRADAGPLRLIQDVVEVELAIADCTDLRKGDVVTCGATAWTVSEKPMRDAHDLLWRATAARAST